MENAIPSLVVFALILLLLAFVTLVLVVCSFYQQIKLLKKQLASLEKEIAATSNSIVAIGQKVIEWETLIRATFLPEISLNRKSSASGPDHPVLKESLPNDDQQKSDDDILASNYDQARSLLGAGKTISEVAHICSLSHAEVSLLNTLERQGAQRNN